MSRRLLVIPRWGGGPASDWYPWLAAELGGIESPPFDRVEVAAMPDPDLPTVAAWVARVRMVLGDDPVALRRTVVAGHSVGCQAVLRALAELPDGARVDGVLCVAGWFWVDEPWASLRPWLETPLDLDRTRRAAGDRVVAVLSDDDPFTSHWRANAAAWAARLGATTVMVPGAGHFNGRQYPPIRQTLLDHLIA
jgi:predicted alpha/beta hydrolase family esterase